MLHFSFVHYENKNLQSKTEVPGSVHDVASANDHMHVAACMNDETGRYMYMHDKLGCELTESGGTFDA